MDKIITPEPHLIPGYTGHCPQMRYRVGKTFGRQTHRLLMDPCLRHAPRLIVSPIHRVVENLDHPTKLEKFVMSRRDNTFDTTYHDPIIPGYEGHVPNMIDKVGRRYIAAATAGLVQHEFLMERLRCEKQHLRHREVLESGAGLYQTKKGERVMQSTIYRPPLQEVVQRSRGIKKDRCPYRPPKERYHRDMVPHFLPCNHEEKFIVNGFAGHIPQANKLFGLSSKPLAAAALCDFLSMYQLKLKQDVCPEMKTPQTDSCDAKGTFEIYSKEHGMLPWYGGHVPGELYSFGLTYGNATRDAKNWIKINKEILYKMTNPDRTRRVIV